VDLASRYQGCERQHLCPPLPFNAFCAEKGGALDQESDQTLRGHLVMFRGHLFRFRDVLGFPLVELLGFPLGGLLKFLLGELSRFRGLCSSGPLRTGACANRETSFSVKNKIRLG
jgi:hypothetical protein